MIIVRKYTTTWLGAQNCVVIKFDLWYNYNVYRIQVKNTRKKMSRLGVYNKYDDRDKTKKVPSEFCNTDKLLLGF